jgi:hypothetical protein
MYKEGMNSAEFADWKVNKPGEQKATERETVAVIKPAEGDPIAVKADREVPEDLQKGEAFPGTAQVEELSPEDEQAMKEGKVSVFTMNKDGDMHQEQVLNGDAQAVEATRANTV